MMNKQLAVRFFYGLVLISMFPILGWAQKTGSLSGKIMDKQTQQPLAEVTIQLQGVFKSTFTDSLGQFRLSGIPLRTYNLIVSRIGYKPQTLYNIIVSAGNENNITIDLEPAANLLNEVIVKNNRRTAKAATIENPLSVQRLTTEEIKSNPGGNFDISKVIQTLPGVGGGQQGFRNDIVIRGGAPNENVFYLDGIEIPVLNHFQTQGSSGGPQGMLNVSFIEDVKLSTSAFDAKYDNAMSSVFQFKQKNGNPNKIQGNVRLSATELAATLEGPLAKNKRTTFLASARRSYLQVIFSLLDLPIRPNYWDFQTKISHQINKKTTLSFIGLGAIDAFSFASIKSATPEKAYIYNSTPFINQWNYTGGLSIKRLLNNGYLNVALSRNSFDNDNKQYEDNQLKLPSQLTLLYQSRETENKLRFDVNQTIKGFRLAYGGTLQLAEYTNSTYNVIRKAIYDANGVQLQPATTVNFNSPLGNFYKYGAFIQISKRLFDNRLGVSVGTRTDMNSYTTDGNNPLKTISPRLSLSYVLTNNLTLNGSIGRYFKLAPYTILGFADSGNQLVNKSVDYLQSTHYVAGLEYLPNDGLRFTLEGFYKQYNNVLISARNGISLSNLGSDFSVLGNEKVTSTGKGNAYGVEFFAQKKLTNRFFGLFSYTYYRSQYSGSDGQLVSSNWDNRHLVSLTWGYKFNRNWELGLKFRLQGKAPYTPYDTLASRINYLSLGQGIFDYSKLNTQRVNPFNSCDIRIDKKWNFKKITIDLFFDVTNFYAAKNPVTPSYTFKRTDDNSAFVTTDNRPLQPDGSNAIPVQLKNDDPSVLPTVGFIVEF